MPENPFVYQCHACGARQAVHPEYHRLGRVMPQGWAYIGCTDEGGLVAPFCAYCARYMRMPRVVRRHAARLLGEEWPPPQAMPF